MAGRQRAATAGMLVALAGCASQPTATKPSQRGMTVAPLTVRDATRDFDRALSGGESAGSRKARVAPETLALATRPARGELREAEAPGPRDLDVTLNFKAVDAREVFREVFEKVLDVDYVLAADLGTTAREMSFVVEGRMSHVELFRTLDSICDAYGLALVEQEGIVQVVSAKDAVKRASPVRVGWERVGENLTTGTHVLALTNALATDIAEGIKPMLSDRGLAFSPKGTNVLVLIDSPSNMDRLLKVVRELDQPAFASRTFRLYSPTHISATEFATSLTDYVKSLGVRVAADATSQFTAVTLPRSQQVFVTTSLRDLVPALDAWFDRLDRALDENEPVTRLYWVQHASPGLLQSAIAAAFDKRPEAEQPVVTTLASITAGESAAPLSQGTQTGGAADTRQAGATTTGAGATGGVGAAPSRSPASAGVTETLLIRARPDVYKEVRELIDMLDTPPKQVYLQVVVAEVTLTADLQFGVELFLRQEVDDIPWEIRSAASAVANPIGSAFILSGNAFALVEAAANEGNVRVLSAPYTLATSGKSAELNVGSEVPVITQQISGTQDAADPTRISNSVEYRKAGVILTVSPKVNDRGEVTLQITQEVSDVVQPTPGATIQSPSFTQRQVQTNVTVRSGDTAALGGIRLDRENEQITGIPLLMDIPLIGLLFQGKNVMRTQTELVILVTPTIVLEPSLLPQLTPEFLAGVVNLELIDDLLLHPAVKTSEMLLR